jgi:hypothetical protein
MAEESRQASGVPEHDLAIRAEVAVAHGGREAC